MAQDLGLILEHKKLRLVRGYGMPPTGLVRRDAARNPIDWDAGTVGKFVFEGGAVWTATLNGPRMLWTATQAQVEAQPSGTAFYIVIDGVPYFECEVIRNG